MTGKGWGGWAEDSLVTVWTLTTFAPAPLHFHQPHRSTVRLNVCSGDVDFAFGDKPFFVGVMDDVRRGRL